jgi:putative hemolysin
VLVVAQSDYSWVWTLLGILSIPALVALNGFFVTAEFALVAVRKTRVEELVSHGIKGAASAADSIQHLDRTIAATQLGITLASIGLGWVAEGSMAGALSAFFASLEAPWDVIATHSMAVTLAFFIITFMHVVFGELIPKTIALQSPDRMALWVARPLNIFAKVVRPVVLLMNGTGNWLVRRLGYHTPSGEGLVHSVEELALLIEDTEEAGILEPEQAELLQNVFRLSDKTVRDCMVPREKVATLELTTPPEKVLEIVRAGAHTRMPVYEGTLDKIVGIVNTKDLFYLFSLRGVVVLEDAMYPPLFLKPDESVANGLRLFRKAKRPMALVRDDDGNIHGLITLEDILEEIIGDIEDEHDRPTPKVVLKRKVKVAKSTPALPEKK